MNRQAPEELSQSEEPPHTAHPCAQGLEAGAQPVLEVSVAQAPELQGTQERIIWEGSGHFLSSLKQARIHQQRRSIRILLDGKLGWLSKNVAILSPREK